MSEVQDLAERWLGALHALDIPTAVELLADDAVLEMPLAPPGLPNRFEGKAAIRTFLTGTQLFSKLEFHRYALVIRAREGQVVLYREYFNPLALAGAFKS
jgi:ketosteroid isomerase-like protein